MVAMGYIQSKKQSSRRLWVDSMQNEGCHSFISTRKLLPKLSTVMPIAQHTGRGRLHCKQVLAVQETSLRLLDQKA
jgi:hypothetical protein